LLFLLAESPSLRAADVKVLSWKKIATHPHDPDAFTQGLIWLEPDILGESMGRYGESKVRRVRISTGKVESEASLDQKLFGEGLAKIGSDFFQLTWQEHKVLVWNWARKGGFSRSKEWTWDGEGWGLTAGKKNLYLSDGSSTIFEIDPKTFKTIRKIAVKANGKDQDRLNELEWIDGKIFANVWQSTMVLCINPESGVVEGILDFNELVPNHIAAKTPDAVLNGLAWNPKQRRLYVTGKLWPVLYELSLQK
jgi:glutamine cyclotransferase